MAEKEVLSFHPYSEKALRQQPDHPFLPSIGAISATRGKVLLGMYDTPDQEMGLYKLHDSFQGGLKPTELQVTEVFGLLLQGLVADGLIELEKDGIAIGYKLTPKGAGLIESIRNSTPQRKPK